MNISTNQTIDSLRNRRRTRAGFTLLEVLISGVVISVGLLGVAAMVPMAKYLVSKAIQADMASCYGRAGLRMIAADGNLSAGALNWNGGPMTSSTAHSGKDAFDYHCSADLVEFMKRDPAIPFPTYMMYADKTQFEWLATVRDLGSGFYDVSVAVSYHRAVDGYKSGGTFSGGYGGGSITGFGETKEIKPGEWVFICSSGDTNNGHWFKVMDISPTTVSVSGPDWLNHGGSVTVATPGGVVGVFSEVIKARNY